MKRREFLRMLTVGISVSLGIRKVEAKSPINYYYEGPVNPPDFIFANWKLDTRIYEEHPELVNSKVKIVDREHYLVKWNIEKQEWIRISDIPIEDKWMKLRAFPRKHSG